MLSFTRMVVSSALAGALLTVTPLVSGAPAATVGKPPQAIGPCGPELPPQARCGPKSYAKCVETRWVVKYKNDRKYNYTCCAKWQCFPLPPR